MVGRRIFSKILFVIILIFAGAIILSNAVVLFLKLGRVLSDASGPSLQ